MKNVTGQKAITFNETPMWKLIEISLADDHQLLSMGFEIALRVESLIKPTQIYFAHYSGNSLLRVSLETEHENKAIKEILKNNLRSVMSIAIKDGSGSGSFIHALGYQICRELKQFDREGKREKLGDLFHWMQNMLGFTYSEEESNHLEWAEIAKTNNMRSET